MGGVGTSEKSSSPKDLKTEITDIDPEPVRRAIEANVRFKEQIADVTKAVIVALKATRSQGAYALAEELSEKYLGGAVVVGGDQVTTTDLLHKEGAV